MPRLVATVQIACPVATPAAVPVPARRPPISVLRIVRAVSWPGVRMTTRAMARNAANEDGSLMATSMGRWLDRDPGRSGGAAARLAVAGAEAAVHPEILQEEERVDL